MAGVQAGRFRFLSNQIPWRYIWRVGREQQPNATFLHWISSPLEIKLSMLTQERVREIHQLWVRCKYKKASVLPTDCAATLPSLPFPERLASDSSTRKLLWVPFSRLLTWPTKLCLTFLDGVIPAYFFFFLTHLNLILGKLREKKKTHCSWCLQYSDFLWLLIAWKITL